MPLSEDKVSLGDEEFIVPVEPVEQERFKRRLMATAKVVRIVILNRIGALMVES